MKLKFCDEIEILFNENEETLIEHKKNREHFRVGGAGSDFLKLVDGERSMDDIIQKLLEIYGGVEPYILVKDMEGFFQDLTSNGIVEIIAE